MKKLFTSITIVAILCITTSSLAQSYGHMDVGYSTRSINLKPVFGFGFGYVFFNADDYAVRPLLEAGVRGHTDQQANAPVYAHLSTGIQLNNYLAITAGVAYGGNQQKQDRHVTGDTVIVLTPGAAKETYTSYHIAVRGMQKIVTGGYIIEYVAVMKGVWFYGAGMKFNL